MVDKKVTDMAPLADPSGAVVYGVKNATDHQIMVGSMVNKNDAPSDGKNYVRKNGSWVEGGVSSVNGESGTVELTSADIPHITSDLITVTSVSNELHKFEQFYGRVFTAPDETTRLSGDIHPDITIVKQLSDGTVWALPASVDPAISGNWINIGNLSAVSIHVGQLDPHTQYLNTTRGDSRYVQISQVGAALGVAPLNAQGVIELSYLPPLAAGRRVIVADELARLSLSVWPDLTIAIQSSDGSSWLLDANADPSVPSNWTLNGNTANDVQSFNARTGNVLPTTGDYTADQITQTANREFVTPSQKLSWDLKLSDAPNDGITYVRRDGAWEPKTDVVSSVNGKIGNVILDNTDVGAAAAAHTHTSINITDFDQATVSVISNTLVAGENTDISVSNVNGTVTISDRGNDSLLIWQGI